MSKHTTKAPGKSTRVGLTVMQLLDAISDDKAAGNWFEETLRIHGRYCGHCGAVNTVETKSGRPMKYRCRECKKHFNVRTGTFLPGTHIPLRKWVYAIYLSLTSLKGISSMKLHRELDISQKSAWYMLHRIREAMKAVDGQQRKFKGGVEADETYIGGKEKNKHESKKLKKGSGTVGKTALVGVKERETGGVRAEVVAGTSKVIIEEFVGKNVEEGSTLYTDEASVYDNIADFKHEAVNHSAGEYVRDTAHTNSIEAFWSTFKRGYIGTYHKMSDKHLKRYVAEFAGRNNVRDSHTSDQMKSIPRNMAGTHLPYKELVKDWDTRTGNTK